ncbi:GxxExxY protein [Belliella buryatensis]|uniref:GxxExxY protein n=1 Tax=Belliella buryatensis TaxID=1500549 RepID=A0A239GDC3_9BACT|nr:GxxExxY protein [Belliella buryatensis]SNS66742.1 GxxExxY protein [Belliella buryatensis]
MTENEISKEIINSCYTIHSELGPGLYENIYENILAYELSNKGFDVKRQKPIPVIWQGMIFENSFKADLIIENKVLIELKSIEALSKVHYKQVITYLKLTNIKLGLLINFNESLLRDGVKRIVFGL